MVCNTIEQCGYIEEVTSFGSGSASGVFGLALLCACGGLLVLGAIARESG